MSFGARLKQARSKNQLTQTEVANRLGINFTTISKYENDKSQPDNDILTKLSELYGVTIDWLLTGSTPEKGQIQHRFWVDGEQEILTHEEALHLKDSLEMYRLLREKRAKESGYT